MRNGHGAGRKAHGRAEPQVPPVCVRRGVPPTKPGQGGEVGRGGHRAVSGDISSPNNWGAAPGIWRVEPREAAPHPMVHGMAPRQRVVAVQMSPAPG